MTHAFTPLRFSLGWLIGTYVLFLVVGDIAAVPDLFKLSAFVALTIACFAGGYWLRAVRFRSEPAVEVPDAPQRVRHAKTLVVLSAGYYLAYGLAYMGEYGVRSVSSVVNAVADPGSAYLAKFDVYAFQNASNLSNPIIQALTLAAVLAAPLVPLLFIYWRQITPDIKLLAFAALAVYAALFVALGTLVGLGNILIFTAVGYLMTRARTTTQGRRRRRAAGVLVALIAATFAGYMIYNQSARLMKVGIQDRYEPNPIVAAVAGDDLARGATVMAFYPTHGYLGLAYNLETPFEWTEGRGAARALDSYLAQYQLADTVSRSTYPERTEARTGWDAGMYWSTIYPWLASDLTWFGAALFMGLVGWWMARWWHEAVAGSWLALLLFAQSAVLVAYVPANNQLGLSRPNLIGVVTLLALYAATRVKKRGARRSPSPGSEKATVDLEPQASLGGESDVRSSVVVDGVGDRVSGSNLRRHA